MLLFARAGLLAGLILSVAFAAMPDVSLANSPADPRIDQLIRMIEAQQRRIEQLEERLARREAIMPVAVASQVTQGQPAGIAPATVSRNAPQAAGAAGAAGAPPPRPRQLAASLRPLHMTALSDSFRFLSGDANADPQTAEVEHGFRPGLEGELLFAPAGRNFAVSLGGRHIGGKDSASTVLSNIALYDAGFGGPAGSAGETVTARSEVKSWQIDLDLRSRPKAEGIGLFAGLRLAELNRDLDITNNVDAVAFNQAKFRGLGPRFGADGRLPLGGGFYLDGSASGALLFGNGEIASQTNTNGLTPNLFYQADNQRAVPVLDGRIALGWDLIEEARGIEAQGMQSLGIEFGLRAQHWMGVQDFVTSTDTLVGAANIGDADMTFAGPYMAVTARW